MAIRFEDTKPGEPAPKAKPVPVRPPVEVADDTPLVEAKGGKAKAGRRGKGR